MSVHTIYKALRDAGLSLEGACGLMGNLHAESNMQANIAQRGMTKLSDEGYTSLFDDDALQCSYDGVGYGLAQWTYPPRKINLHAFAKARGVSVGVEHMQVQFIIHELKTEYAGLYKYLCATKDLYVATERVCKEYERPAVNNIDARLAFAQTYIVQFGPKIEEPPVEVSQTNTPFRPPSESILVMQAVLVSNGYNTEMSGFPNADFIYKMNEFIKDIKEVWNIG